MDDLTKRATDIVEFIVLNGFTTGSVDFVKSIISGYEAPVAPTVAPEAPAAASELPMDTTTTTDTTEASQ